MGPDVVILSNDFTEMERKSRFRVMEAGIANHLWTIEELVALLPKHQARMRGPYKKQ
jgi:hypothetical protein